MQSRLWIRTAVASCLLGCIAPVAFGDVITFVTPTGSTTTGGAVNASATFTTSADTLMIDLSNLLANPTDVAQLISDLEFTLSAPTAASTLTSSSGQQITVNANGSTTLGGTVLTGWALNASGTNDITLCVICAGTNAAPAPTQLVIGPGPYTNANGSIAGNPAHNPFINQTATFTISNSLITADTTVTNAVFSFGTTAGINVTGTEQVPPSSIPEPATLALLGLGVGGIGFVRRRSRNRSRVV